MIKLTPLENKKRIDIGNFVTVIKALAMMDPPFADSICKKRDYDIFKVLKNYQNDRDNREQESIDQKKVNERIEVLNAGFSPEETKALEFAEKANEWLIKQNPDGQYRRQPLQMHMVAKITGTKGLKFTLSEHPPGTGKSWIIALLIAAYHLK